MAARWQLRGLSCTLSRRLLAHSHLCALRGLASTRFGSNGDSGWPISRARQLLQRSEGGWCSNAPSYRHRRAKPSLLCCAVLPHGRASRTCLHPRRNVAPLPAIRLLVTNLGNPTPTLQRRSAAPRVGARPGTRRAAEGRQLLQQWRPPALVLVASGHLGVDGVLHCDDVIDWLSITMELPGRH